MVKWKWLLSNETMLYNFLLVLIRTTGHSPASQDVVLLLISPDVLKFTAEDPVQKLQDTGQWEMGRMWKSRHMRRGKASSRHKDNKWSSFLC